MFFARLKQKLNGGNTRDNYSGKSLICSGTRDTMRCRLDSRDLPTLPANNIQFSLTTSNNLSSVDSDYMKKTSQYRVQVDADKDSSIFCREDRGKYGLIMRCRAKGPNTPNFPDTWEPIIDLDSFHEVESEAVKSEFQSVIEESFPERKEELSKLKPFRMLHLKGSSIYGLTRYWIDESGRMYPVMLAFNPDVMDEIEEEKVRNEFRMTAIHELTHVSRWYGDKYSLEAGKEEGETVTESLIRGDWKVRIRHPTPHGYVESIVYVPHCALPDKYCFDSLKEARDFEEHNYELVSGEEKPKAINPENTPDWSKIESKIPAAPAVDMLKHMHGSGDSKDVVEWWINTRSQGGNEYLYSVYDLRVDGEEVSQSEALEVVDEADARVEDENVQEVEQSG